MAEDTRGPRLTGPPDEEEMLRELLESAGRRPAVPAEDLARIQAAARAEWESLVAAGETRRRMLRRAVPLALAAGLLLAVAIPWWRKAVEPPPVTVATVQLLKGEVQGVAVGDRLASGTALATGGGALAALRLPGGESVRLDGDTRVRLVSGTRIELERGAVYVDSSRPDGGALEIGTPFGSVHEAGTQFEVRVEAEETLVVRVREGAVALVRRGGSAPVAAGEELRLRHDGSLSRGTVAPHGPAWDWVQAAAPALEIEGTTLDRYLGWAARETGRRLRYGDETLDELAAGTVLHGTIEGMTPDESLSVVVPGSGLGYRTEDGTLLVIRTPE